MCQVDEEYPAQLERLDLPSVSKKCVKCKEGCASVVIRVGDTYCRACFKEYFIHKFRAMLGKNRVIFPGEKVLLAVSGGPSSCSMLSQVQEGLSQSAHKKLRFLPGIVYIDEGGAVGLSAEERQRTVSQLQTIFRSSGFPFHVVPLEQILELPSSVLVAAPPPLEQPATTYKAAVDLFIQSNNSQCVAAKEPGESLLLGVENSHTQALQQLLSSAKTLTAREDLLSTLRQHLLVHTARTQGYSKLMFGDSSTRLAVKLLTCISLGRGAQLAQDTGFSDSRYGDIISVRPMRDYSAKEIAYYNHMFNVPLVVIPSLTTKAAEKASIQHLTESFVVKLQADFPSTVSTIYRTSEKLRTACSCPSQAGSCDRCLLCMCTLDTAAGNASAFQATLISKYLSNNRPQAAATAAAGSLSLNTEPVKFSSAQCSPTAGECCGGAVGTPGCCSTTQPVGVAELKSLLCYSCQLTVRDVSSVDGLPLYILSEAQRRIRRSQLKEEIQDFLLEDSDEGD